jgi:hypothetical protein
MTLTTASSIRRARFAALALALVTLTLVAPASAQQPMRSASPGAMRVFRSQRDGFSLMMPGTPVRTTKVLQADVGPVDYTQYMLDLGTMAYAISFTDYPASLLREKSVDAILDDAQSGAVSGMKARLVRSSEVQVQGHPGRFFVATVQGMSFYYQTCLVGRRLYQVAYAAPGSGPLDANARAFFKSFTLL